MQKNINFYDQVQRSVDYEISLLEKSFFNQHDIKNLKDLTYYGPKKLDCHLSLDNFYGNGKPVYKMGSLENLLSELFFREDSADFFYFIQFYANAYKTSTLNILQGWFMLRELKRMPFGTGSKLYQRILQKINVIIETKEENFSRRHSECLAKSRTLTRDQKRIFLVLDNDLKFNQKNVLLYGEGQVFEKLRMMERYFDSYLSSVSDITEIQGVEQELQLKFDSIINIMSTIQVSDSLGDMFDGIKALAEKFEISGEDAIKALNLYYLHFYTNKNYDSQIHKLLNISDKEINKETFFEDYLDELIDEHYEKGNKPFDNFVDDIQSPSEFKKYKNLYHSFFRKEWFLSERTNNELKKFFNY